MLVDCGHIDGQRLRAVRHEPAERLSSWIEIQPRRQRRLIGKGCRVGQGPPARIGEGVGGESEVHLASPATLRSSLIGHHGGRRRRGLHREGLRGGKPAGIGRRHHDTKAVGVVRNHPDEGLP